MNDSTPSDDLAWVPQPTPDPLIVLRRSGKWWDAVRVPLYLAELIALHDTQCAVLCDPAQASAYFFVPPGSTAGQTLPRSYALGDTEYLEMPTPGRTHPPGSYWLRAPQQGAWMTDTTRLIAALETTIATLYGPRPVTP